jgi:hypothetical protein
MLSSMGCGMAGSFLAMGSVPGGGAGAATRDGAMDQAQVVSENVPEVMG